MAAPRSMLLPLMIMFTILGGGNFVVATLVLSHAPAVILTHSTWFVCGWILFFLLQTTAPILQVQARSGVAQSRASERSQWIAYAAMGILSTMLVIALVLELISWTGNLVTGYQFEAMIDDIWFWSMTGLSVVTAVLGLFQASIGLKIKTIEILLEHLPVEFDGYKIAQISDLHVSSLIGRRYTQMVVDRVNQLSPDIIVMTGDFIDGSVQNLQYRVAPLGTLKSPDGRFFITGNHEYYYGAQSWVDEHRRLGTTVLLNEHRIIKRRGAEILLAGVTDRSGGAFFLDHKQDIDKSLQGAPKEIIKILLAHHPGCYKEAESKGIDLQLSGHTHGGQFFPWQFAVKLIHRYYHGLYRHGRMWVYVNPGTGFWGPPLRSTVPPEITLLILKRRKNT